MLMFCTVRNISIWNKWMNHLKTNLFISSNEQIYLKDISCVIAPETHFLGFTFNTVPGKTPVQCIMPEHNVHACSMQQK